MTDDYLADFERELHAAARRRGARPVSRPLRWAAPAFAAAAVAMALVLADPAEREVEVPATPPPAQVNEVELRGVAPATSCEAERGDVAAPDKLGVFRRPQRGTDGPTNSEMASVVGAADYDVGATRSPAGLEERVLLSPTSRVGCREGGEPGVCLVVAPGSRCFTMTEIASGEALLRVDRDTVAGIVPDGIQSVVIETGETTATTSVTENAFSVIVPPEATSARVTLRAVDSGCVPPEALRRAVPALDREPPGGGVPAAIRRRFGHDSAVIGKHARVWDDGDGVTYWVVPELRCDGAEADAVCVVPLFEEDRDAAIAGGGDACATLAQLDGDPVWVHFPLRDGGAAVAGLAPPGLPYARVRAKGDFEQRFKVEEGVWGGTMTGFAPPGEVGALDVAFEGRGDSWAPVVATRNGTTEVGLASDVMNELARMNYRRAERGVGNWPDPDVERTVVYEAPGDVRVGERIAIYLDERYGIRRPEVREMTARERELAGPDADALVVAGRDLSR